MVPWSFSDCLVIQLFDFIWDLMGFFGMLGDSPEVAGCAAVDSVIQMVITGLLSSG